MFPKFGQNFLRRWRKCDKLTDDEQRMTDNDRQDT